MLKLGLERCFTLYYRASTPSKAGRDNVSSLFFLFLYLKLRFSVRNVEKGIIKLKIK